MSGERIAGLIAILACLFLATRSLRARRLSFETGAAMAVAWLLIIVVVTFVVARFGG